MKILVVGAGLGGLATALALSLDGHKVTVVDSVREFAEVGAGIRMPPNSIRLLERWGVDFDKMKKSMGGQYRFYRWEDGTLVNEISFKDVLNLYGAPYYQIHRADLHAGILTAAQEAGAKIFTSARVVDYDFIKPSVTLADGRVMSAELIVASDGIKSIARGKLLGRQDQPENTGDVAYRIQISNEGLLQDPALADLISKPGSSYWIGPDAHVVGYPIRDGEIYNIIVCHTTDFEEQSDGSWTVVGDTEELRSRFASWEPRVRKLMDLVPGYLKWNLCTIRPLERWVHPEGKVVLLGDCCHPMLPYLSQGAAQAFEDAGTLRACLKKIPDMKKALQTYETIRMPRTELIAAKTKEHQYILHIQDGPEQAERDVKMANDSLENPVFWGEASRRKWLFSHDSEDLDILDQRSSL